MSKKNFKDSPALAFINPQENAQDSAPVETQKNTQQVSSDDTQNIAQDEAQERKGYIRTQGRKGFKKPRINLAFDSEMFLDKIRTRADYEGKSITQFVNDIVADYLKKCERKKLK